MWVESVEIKGFRNFTDEQYMAVERDVTCLIGKNESRKTTVLKALHRLKPANNGDVFNETKEEEDIETLAEQEDQASVVAVAKEMAKTLTAARNKAVGRVPAVLARYESLLTEGLSEEQEQAVLDRLPRFFYFSDYEMENHIKRLCRVMRQKHCPKVNSIGFISELSA